MIDGYSRPLMSLTMTLSKMSRRGSGSGHLPARRPRRRAAHPAQRLLLRHVQLSRRKAVHGQRPVLRQRRVRQGQVHPQRRQRLSTLPLVSAGQPISIFFFSTLLSVLFLRFQRIYLLSYQPSSGFQISVSATGLRHGHGPENPYVPGAASGARCFFAVDSARREQ